MTDAAQPIRLPSERDLMLLFPRAPQTAIHALVRGEPKVRAAGLLSNANRLAMFLAQVGHESAGLTTTRENLNYSADRLVAVWPSRFPSVAEARPFARNPARLAEKVYGGRRELGNVNAGDGARYIGRGWLQITGRANYRAVGKAVGVDLEGQPELAETPDGALITALGFWTLKKLAGASDGGDVAQVTRVINGGLTGLDDRRARFRLALDVING